MDTQTTVPPVLIPSIQIQREEKHELVSIMHAANWLPLSPRDLRL